MAITLLKGAFNKALKILQPKKKVISWLQEKIIKHQPYGKTNSFVYNGHPIYYMSPGEFLHAADEIFEREIYRIEFSNPCPVIIDCGANIGMSVVYFKKIAPQANIIAYEPDTVNFEFLQKNTVHLSNVKNVQAALWINNDNLEFEDVSAQGSKISSGGIGSDKKIKIVEGVRLKDVLEGQTDIDLLKVDIEGAEYEVIKDCRNSLTHVRNIFLEYHGTFANQHQLIELLQIVDNAGFNYHITSATETFKHPFILDKKDAFYDQQLNIFCTKKTVK
jgi:FkbM family methyltransferase